MSKYAWIFLIGNIVIGIVLGILLELIGTSSGSATSNIAAAIGASYFAGHCFAKDKEREPSDDEKKQFAITALAYVTVFALALIVVLTFIVPSFSFSSFQTLFQVVLGSSSTMMLVIGAVVILFLIYYYAMKFFFAQGAKAKLQ